MQLQVETQIYKKNAIGQDITAAGHRADEYITYIDAENGIQVHDKATVGTSYDDYVQINSDDISMWRDNKEMMALDDDDLTFYSYSEDANNNTIKHTSAIYGNDGIVLYKPGTIIDGNGNTIAHDTAVISINSSGADIDGTVNIGGRAQDYYLNENVQVGGRNLLCDTGTAKTFTAEVNKTWFVPVSTEPYMFSTYSNKVIADTNNLQYTLSFNYAIKFVDATFNLIHALKFINTTTASETIFYNGEFIKENIPIGQSAGSVRQTFDIDSDIRELINSDADEIEIEIVFGGTNNINNENIELIISNLKFEIGNKATDWTPAPEDVQAEIDAKVCTWTLKSSLSEGATYDDILSYINNANYTFGIDDTATGYDRLSQVRAGDMIRLHFKANNMGTNGTWVYIVGTAQTVSSNSVVLIRMSLDSTVIDGGHILTGSIDATKVNISNLTVGAQNGWDELLNSNVNVGGRNYAITNWTVTSPYTNSSTNVTTTLVGPSNFTLNGTAAATNWAFNKADTFGGQILTTGTYLIWFDQPNVGIDISYGNSSVRVNSCTKNNPYKLSVETEQTYLFVPIVISGVTYSNLNVHLMIEKGDNPTDWSPAPEDVNTVSYYGVCTTAADVAAKEVNNYDSFILKAGAIVSIKFNNGNTCTSNLTLNVNGTGAKNVYMLNSNSNIAIGLGSNSIVTLIYDGANWRVLSLEQVSGMVTRIDDNGISIHPSGTTQHRAEITSQGMDVYQSGISVAKYGTTTRIGAISANTYRTEITSNGFKILQRNSGNTADTEISSFNSGGISFNANIPLTVGTDNSYIKWIKENNVWKIKIQADEITMGGHSIDTGGTWYTGTAITGTSTTATIFSSSGITYALVGDMYLNTSTNNTYRCTVEGNAATAKWIYVSNLKGANGTNGTNGINGTNGTSYYVHIRYSANSDGTDFTTSPQSNTQYIGIYSGTSSTAPTEKTSYTWSKYKGDKGDDTSSQYMTFTSANGLRVYSGDKTNNTYNTSYTQIKTDGITLVKGGYTAAIFGSSIILNKPGTETAVVTIDSNGNATINNIKATSGTIGGYDLTTNSIQAQIDASGNKVSAGLFWHFMSWGASNLAFGVGTRATTSDSWNWKFKVTHDGLLTATGADITGAIKATSGLIGASNATYKITIGTNTTNASIYYGMSSLGSTANGFYIGTDGISIGGGKFKVTAAGVITATGLSIGQSQVSGLEDALNGKAASGAENTAKSYLYYKNATDGLFIAKSVTQGTTPSSGYIQLQSSEINIVGESTSYRTTINSNGMRVYAGDANNPVASFGSTATIGKITANNGNVRTTSTGIELYIYNNLIGRLYQKSNHIPIWNQMVNSNTTVNATVLYGSQYLALFSNHTSFPVFESDGEMISMAFGPVEEGHDARIFYLEGDSGGADTRVGIWDADNDRDNSETFFAVDTNSHCLCFGVGSGDVNRGIYEDDLSKWVLYLHENTSTTQKVLTGFGGWTTGSDLKKKNIIGTIDYATDLIMSLKPKQYYWKDDIKKKINLGFVAQEVAEISKKLNLDLDITVAHYIDESKGEYNGEDVDDSELEWFLDYNELIAPLVQVVQDQQREIEQLKKEVAELKNK